MRLHVPLCTLLLAAGIPAAAAPDPALAFLTALHKRVPKVRAVPLPARPGEIRLTPEQSVTVEDLRGVRLDDTPPAMKAPSAPYAAEQTDEFAAGAGPYVAPGIAPFRLKEFTAEFNYGGWHNFRMMEYAATHGFGVIFPYVMPDHSHFPAGTRWLQWNTFVEWPKFMADHAIPDGRYDRLADVDVAAELAVPAWSRPGPDWIAMLDLEHGGPLSPEDLRKQTWYPASVSDAERQAFEDRYYRGYLSTYTGPIQALRRKGWTSVGVYPQPYGSGWFALLALAEKGQPGLPDPRTYWPWLRYGRALVQAQDVLYPDVYLYYRSPQNAAYTLARLDFDRALLATLPKPPPVRPYYWPLLHGGDASYHWWTEQPLPNEDMRAMVALGFFAGTDGLTLWNWSGTGNHQAPPPLMRSDNGKLVGADVMLRDGLSLRPIGAAGDSPPVELKRYDVVRVVSVDEARGTVRFRRIAMEGGDAGAEAGPDRPEFEIRADELRPHLRPPAEAVAGAIEGLALIKAFEPFLRRATPKVDVPSLDQFARTLPIVRRMKWGGVHLLATYDPLCVRGDAPRTVALSDFDGRKGVRVSLPADAQLRLFVLRDR